MIKLLGTAIIALVVLSGCTASPSPTDPSVQPQPSTASDPGLASSIELTSTGIVVKDADGVEIGVEDMTDDPARVVGLLSDAIGADPIVTEETLDTSCIAATTYNWNDEIVINDYTDDRRDPFPQTELIVSSASAGGIAVLADAGFAVGDDITALLGAIPEAQQSAQGASVVWSVSGVDTTPQALPIGGVAFYEPDTKVVTHLLTPGAVLSGGC